MDQHRTAFAAMIRSTLWDLGLPAATYYVLHFAGVGDTAALMAATGTAGARLAWVAVRSRRLSPFSLLMAAVFGVGLIFTLLTGDPRMMLLKHSAMSVAVGLAFLVTALRGRPLTLAAQQSVQPARASELAAAYETNPLVRRGHRAASLVWGFGLLTEALVRVVLLYVLPVDVMVGLSTVLTVVTFGALFAWNARYVAARTREAHALAA